MPTDFSIWSVGEEESTRSVVALDWTTLPIAKHQRYALGVLTSNHILAVWASNSTPTEAVTWERILIINHVLDSYFKTEEVDENVWRLRRRIRSFAWSPRFYHSSQRTRTRAQYLALANEYNEIILVAIRTPLNVSKPGLKPWDVSVLFHFSICSSTNDPVEYSSQLKDYIQVQRFANHIAWSPWHTVEGKTYSMLALIAGGRLVLKRLKLVGLETDLHLALDDNLVIPGLLQALTGPIKWVPDNFGDNANADEPHSKRIGLCTFSHSEVYELTLYPMDVLEPHIFMRNLDDRWDEVSGTASAGHLYSVTSRNTLTSP